MRRRRSFQRLALLCRFLLAPVNSTVAFAQALPHCVRYNKGGDPYGLVMTPAAEKSAC